MKISLTDAGKRFNREWIFRHFTYSLKKEGPMRSPGPNGSGKSTLLQVLSGSMHFNEGKYRMGNMAIGNCQMKKFTSMFLSVLPIWKW